MHPNKLDNTLAYKFIKAGNSLVTFKSLQTGKHFTFKIRRADDKKIWFVSVLYNPDAGSYLYVGCIFQDDNFRLTKGSKVKEDADSYKCFRWVWSRIITGNIPPELEIWHEGRCGKCGKTLTDPESIERGFGPICFAKMT